MNGYYPWSLLSNVWSYQTSDAIIFSADYTRGDRDRALFPKSCIFCLYGELAPTLEPIG